MARAGAVYPQVEPRAAGMAIARVAIGPSATRAVDALAECRRIGARAYAVGPRHAARAADLERAVALGLGAWASGDLAGAPRPVVREADSEIDVRRHFVAGAPMVLVRRGGAITGAIERDDAGAPAASVASRLERPSSRAAADRLWLLRTAGALGEAMGTPAYAVGGIARDLFLDGGGGAVADVDLVVEGDGIAFARGLCGETGGRVAAHEPFGTASIHGAAAPRSGPLPRIDVATARRECYDEPGALPRVTPGSLGDDLWRRDVTINAMGVALAPSDFGRLIDPTGGRHDARRRALRPLHPLSFVEDPTRLFRAARYAGRFDLRMTTEARAAMALAFRVPRYPALSGQRLRAEIDLLAGEARPAAAFDRVLRWNLLRLWDPGYRAAAATRRRLRGARAFAVRAAAADVDVPRGDVAVLALLMDQPPHIAGACLDRLGVTGAPRRDLVAAASPRLAARLRRARRPSAIAEAIDRRSGVELAGAWIAGGGAARRRVEWFLRAGRAARPALSGADLIAAGVPRGPAVGAYLARLRRARLDGAVTGPDEERRRVMRWLTTSGRKRPGLDQGSIRARKEA